MASGHRLCAGKPRPHTCCTPPPDGEECSACGIRHRNFYIRGGHSAAPEAPLGAPLKQGVADGLGAHLFNLLLQSFGLGQGSRKTVKNEVRRFIFVQKLPHKANHDGIGTSFPAST